MLEMRVRAPTSEQREVFRARIVLLAAEGRSTRSIAKAVDTMPRTVSLWRGRYAREGFAGLADRPHPGAAPKYGIETGKRILAVLDGLGSGRAASPRSRRDLSQGSSTTR